MGKGMFVVTGGAGFIGSAIVWKLNTIGIDDIVIVDEAGRIPPKQNNLDNLNFQEDIEKMEFLSQVAADRVKFKVDTVIHMGATADTTEKNTVYTMQNNFEYTRTLAQWCSKHGIRFIYASSAATYGDGSRGYSDDDSITPALQPLNPYGRSKQAFDVWALKNGVTQKMAGLKFFNVFGPNEYHKGDMASVVFKAFNQIRQTGKVRLFKSYKKEYADGKQCRDFIYVKDCVDVIAWLVQNRSVNGIFNLGTGKARTWNDLVGAVFAAMDTPVNIEYIEMPEFIKQNYQYFTQASMDKLRATGCPLKFHTLEGGIHDYVTQYLQKNFTNLLL